jgi:signal transduction histidine kinase/DNA-binding response OmpR family regulator/ligand-binding sensor domain-containing protein
MKRRQLLFAILVSFNICFGSNLNLPFSRFSPEEGIIPDRIQTIGQDGQGYIWMYGANRIVRFDGYTYKYYNTCFLDDKKLEKRSFPKVKYFVCGLDKQIIAVCRGGRIFRYSQKQDRFEGWRLRYSDESEVEKIKGLSASTDHKLIVVADNCIGEIDTNGYLGVLQNVVDLNKNNYEIVTSDNNHMALVFHAESREVYYVDRLNNEVDRLNVLDQIDFKTLVIDPDSGIWCFGTQQIWKYSRAGDLLYEQRVFNKNLEASPSRLNDLTTDLDGRYWMATNTGLFVFDSSTRQIETISYNPFLSNGLIDNDVTAVFHDDKHGIWCGTARGRLTYTNLKMKSFSHFKIYNSTRSSHMVVNGFDEDTDGNIYIATENNGIWKLDFGSEMLDKLSCTTGEQELELTENKCLRIIGDELWIGTENDGLLVYHLKKKTISKKAGWKYSRVDNILQLNNRTLIISGDRHVGMLDTRSGQLQDVEFHNRNNQPIKVNVNCIYQAHDGLILAGAESSYLFVYDFEEGGFVPINNLHERFKTLNKRLIIDKIVESDNKHLLLVTRNGGVLKISENRKDFQWLQRTGRFNLKTIRSLEVDQFDNLWLSSINGLHYLDVEKDRMMQYTKVDGLQSNVFQIRSSLRTKDNRILLGGVNGFNVFYPQKEHLPKVEESVQLTNLYVNNSEVYVGDEDGVLAQELNHQNTLKLSFEQRNFEIKFNSFDYIHVGKIQYRFMLEGYDNNWTYLNSAATGANYSEVPSGEYVFQVCASIDDNWESNKLKQLRIIIKPPWWRSEIAIGIYVFLLGVIIFIIYRILRARIVLQGRVREEKIKRLYKEENIRAKLKFFTNISHEIRTPLSLIAGPIDQLNATGELGDKDRALVGLAQNNIQRLLKLVNQLLEFRRFEAEDFPLYVSPLNLSKFVEKKFGFFSIKANSEGKYFSHSVEKGLEMAWVDEEKVETIIYNLLSNAFKYTSVGDRIDLKVMYADKEKKDHVLILVEDTGTGMSNSHLKNIFQRFFQGTNNEYLEVRGSGVGLSIVDDYVKVHGGTVEVSSEEGKGTIFQISLPILREAYLDKKTSVFIDEEAAPEELMSAVKNGLLETLNSQASVEHKSGVPSVLVIEDNEEMRKFIVSCLIRDYEVYEAENGQIGIEKAQEIIPDLIISDVKMPVMNGLQLCEAIKNENKTSHIPVVLLTAKTTVEDQVEGIEAGADLYLIKPFNSSVLNASVNQLIDQRQKLADKYRNTAGTDIIIEESLSVVDQKLLAEITDVIERELTNPELNIQLVCDQIGFNHQQLYRKLKAISGQSVNEFIRTIRLKHAAHMLKTTRLNITEIMYETGFSNRSYFTKSFKMQYEVGPREYRSVD